MLQERRMYQGNYLSGNKREIFEARHASLLAGGRELLLVFCNLSHIQF
jgi:hypothetical protein